MSATHGLKGGLETLNYEKDFEKRLQALVLKDRIRIREFFLDFDRLRKGSVGEAGVSSILIPSSGQPSAPSTSPLTKKKFRA